MENRTPSGGSAQFFGPPFIAEQLSMYSNICLKMLAKLTQLSVVNLLYVDKALAFHDPDKFLLPRFPVRRSES